MSTSPLPQNTIGARIRKLREERGMSLGLLAERSNVSKSYLSNLETKSQHQRPSAETLYAIAEALDTSMAQLLGRRMLGAPRPPEDPEPSLVSFAERVGLSRPDRDLLASIEWRGDPPRTDERWQFVLNALKSSRAIDESSS